MSDDEVWVQTQITVTPQDDAIIREISKTAILSSTPEVPLLLDRVLYRRGTSHMHFVTDVELTPSGTRPISLESYIPKLDTEMQTYLQGVPEVHISNEYRDEATQTLYMASPCPPLAYYKDIMTSMQETSMPMLKATMAAETVISFPPDTPQDTVVEELSTKVGDRDIRELTTYFTEKEQASMLAPDIMNFVLERALWIIDPKIDKKIKLADKEVQTSIKVNNVTNMAIIDNETQTDLTCEPKDSNSMLLSNYLEAKNMVSDYLENWLSEGIEAIAVVDEIIHEIVDKCTERLKSPMKDQTMQTIVTYRLSGEKEQDILRKLRNGIVVDPMEASFVVEPLIDDLLESVCRIVSNNAPKAVKCILHFVLRRTMTIIDKLEELQLESQPKPLDDVLAKRRQKILDSMPKTETETVYTQTTIGGVSEVQKIKDKEVVCSICRRPSVCQYCAVEQDDAPWEQPKMLRTQDILLAYKPCYIVTTLSEREMNVKPPPPPVKKIFQPVKSMLSSSEYSSRPSGDTMDVLPEPEIMPQESVNEWSYVIDATVMKPVSIGETRSSASRTTSSLDKAKSRSYDQYTCGAPKSVSSETANALKILKNTFCSQENCVTSSLEDLADRCLIKNRRIPCVQSPCVACINRSSSSFSSVNNCCIEQSCKPVSRLRLPTTNTYKQNGSQNHTKSNDNFKIIPICLSQISNSHG
ncbi:uncharacterized protein LOC143217395 [Lasioglossum baleicum]|uniref:uncharacterized protein LOC143217395 n=1 Tax=Lasioglossum baleicum TaxID=434251 RepID=UPI003FCD24EB